MIFTLLLALAAAVVGAAIGYLLARTLAAPESARLQAELAAARKELELERASAPQQRQLLEAHVRGLTQEILSTGAQTLSDRLLAPLGTRLTDFQSQVEKTYDNETRDRTALRTEIEQLRKLNQQVSVEANNLAVALKGQSKTRGNWGELVVERILELSGLTQGREYEKQLSAQAEDGGRRVPDFVVHLPGGRDIVIDSKLALNAYLRASAATDDAARASSLTEHVSAVRAHVRELAEKDYTRLYGIESLDFVLMCVPNEAAYVEALATAPGLFEEAFARKIVLVSPSNLWPTLRAVENMWRLERQSENAAEIARRAGDFYDKLKGFVDDVMDIDRHLKKAAEAHAGALNKLSTGKGNLIGRAEQLRKLGIAVKKQLPLELQKGSDDEEDEGPAALEDRSA
jgi:DNA recombination protein RmuC